VTDHEDHCLGCVIGAFLGDAIGAQLEFQKKISDNDIKNALKMKGGGVFGLAPGQITDDSEMALCLAKGLVEGEGIVSLDRIAKYYGKWLNSKPFDIGNTTIAALSGLSNKDSNGDVTGWADLCKKTSKENNKNSESNGGLMRLTPLAVYCASFENDKDVEELVRAEQELTHSNPVAIDLAISYVLTLREIIRKVRKNFFFEINS